MKIKKTLITKFHFFSVFIIYADLLMTAAICLVSEEYLNFETSKLVCVTFTEALRTMKERCE